MIAAMTKGGGKEGGVYRDMLDLYVKYDEYVWEEPCHGPRSGIWIRRTFSSGRLSPDDSMKLRNSILVVGPSSRKNIRLQDAKWRSTLVNNLEILVKQLCEAGTSEIFIEAGRSQKTRIIQTTSTVILNAI